MKSRLFFFLAALVSALSLTPLVASAQVVVVPAPAPRYEVMPAPRQGWAWRPGYWVWMHGVYMWTPGAWVPVVQQPYPYQVVTTPPPPPRVERLSADALFPFDRGSISDIRQRGIADIAQIAAHLRAQPFDHVDVRGYTDRLGSDAYNNTLSQRRADAVKAELIQQGVPAERIHAEGMGSQDPIVQCSNQDRAALIACLQPNRRVEIVTYLGH